jgi:hypothetical protein
MKPSGPRVGRNRHNTIASRFTDEVLLRLLVAKGLLGRIRVSYTAQPDRVALVNHILTAHDAAELALAAIAHHLEKSPEKQHAYLMNYFSLIEERRPKRKVKGRDYFSQLNDVRVLIKHKGVLPDPKDWKRVGQKTWQYVSAWCKQYLGISLEELDQSTLIKDEKVKSYYNDAKHSFRDKDFKSCLEKLGFACNALFTANQALRNLAIGEARADDALKLAAFGVHANDYLALQQFLPGIQQGLEFEPRIVWKQDLYGHPGNWTYNNASFCLDVFVDVALRIQDADRIPGPFAFHLVYDYKITAVADGVAVIGKPEPRSLIEAGRIRGEVIKRLKRGESFRCIAIEQPTIGVGYRLSSLLEVKEALDVHIVIDENNVRCEVRKSDVRITCVPREHRLITDNFPHLTEIEYMP